MTGQELQTWRLAHKLTQKELAAAIGVADGTVTRWESGEWAIHERWHLSVEAAVVAEEMSPGLLRVGQKHGPYKPKVKAPTKPKRQFRNGDDASTRRTRLKEAIESSWYGMTKQQIIDRLGYDGWSSGNAVDRRLQHDMASVIGQEIIKLGDTLILAKWKHRLEDR